ncbi:hypothetical protein JCM30204_30890 [Dysgonomonas termitidis]
MQTGRIIIIRPVLLYPGREVDQKIHGIIKNEVLEFYTKNNKVCKWVKLHNKFPIKSNVKSK